jgi:hypothetical protein
MQTPKTILKICMLILLLILPACNLPAQATEVDPVLAAQLTLTAAAALTPSLTPSVTSTASPTASPTVALSSTSALTGTPTFPYVTLSQATNCRTGPSQVYTLLDTFQVGQTIQVIGKHPFDSYWYVRSPNNSNVTCWMWGFYATGGNLGNVPIFTPPPTYTPVPLPTFDVAYVDSGKCLGWWTRINLKNTGTLPLKSMSISLKDTVTNETRNSSSNGFQDVNACVLSTVDPSLEPNESYTIVSPSLNADPTGHLLSATITLCTDVSQGGTCATKVLEFTP